MGALGLRANVADHEIIATAIQIEDSLKRDSGAFAGEERPEVVLISQDRILRVLARSVYNIQAEELVSICAPDQNSKPGYKRIEMSGDEHALPTLIQHVQAGGQIALLGIPVKDLLINSHDIIFKELTLKGVYGRELFQTWHKTLHLLDAGLDISPIITHHFPYSDFEMAFDLARSGQAGKIILDWTDV